MSSNCVNVGLRWPMAEISRLSPPVIPPGDAATPLHSELNELSASSANLEPVAQSVSLDLAMASSPSLSSSCVPPVHNTSTSVSNSAVCQMLPTSVSVAVTTGSPTTLVASCSSTPPTPQSHGSESSPGLHSDLALTVPPPPYSALSADLTATVTVPVSDSLVHTDTTSSHLPPPPKKPLTPYMRFSKSVSYDISVTIIVGSDWRLGYRPPYNQIPDLNLMFKPCLFSICLKIVFYFESHVWMTYCH